MQITDAATTDNARLAAYATGQRVTPPFWQAGPCPSWCQMSVPHLDGDEEDMRVHMSAIDFIDLTLEDADVFRFENGEMEVSPSFLSCQLDQSYREQEPHIAMLHGDNHSIHLTLREAAHLRDYLTGLLGQAGGDAP